MRFRFSAPLANPRMENFVERAFFRRSERLWLELLSIQARFTTSADATEHNPRGAQFFALTSGVLGSP